MSSLILANGRVLWITTSQTGHFVLCGVPACTWLTMQVLQTVIEKTTKVLIYSHIKENNNTTKNETRWIKTAESSPIHCATLLSDIILTKFYFFALLQTSYHVFLRIRIHFIKINLYIRSIIFKKHFQICMSVIILW